MSMLKRARRVLKLAAEVDPQSYMTRPEADYMGKAKSASVAKFDALRKAATTKANPFGDTLPTVQTLTNLAQLGSPAKGEYQRTYETVKSLFGHDPDGVAAWQGVNAALSPRTEYLDHAGAASLITANWLAMDKPSDPDTIKNLIHRVHVFGKLYTPGLAAKTPWALDPKTGRYAGMPTGQHLTFGGTTKMGDNVDRAVRVLANIGKLREALMDPAGQPGEHLALLSGGGLAKVPNFAISYSAPRQGTALDMWMSHLMFHPDLDNVQNYSDFLSQVKANLNDPSDLTAIEKKAAKHYPVRSELVKALMKVPEMTVKIKRQGNDGKTRMEDIKVAKFIQELNAKLVSDTPTYLAYKHAVAEAAKKLGWTLAEVQESVWTGVVALAAAKSAGIPPKKIQEYLTADTVRKGWQNHEAFVFPGVVDAYRRAGTDPAAVRELEQRTLEGAAGRSRPGVIPVSDPAHLRRVVAYVPPSNIRGGDAAGPIRRALIQRLTQEGLLDPATGKMRLRRGGPPLQFNIAGMVGAASAQARSGVVDHAPHLIMSDYLEDQGKYAHAALIRDHVTRNPNQPVDTASTQFQHMMQDPSGYGDMSRFLALHPGRFLARLEGRTTSLWSAPPPDRTKAGTIRKAWAPQLHVWEMHHDTPEAAATYHQQLVDEGAIGMQAAPKAEPTTANPMAPGMLKRYHVVNWPERGVTDTPHLLARRPAKLAQYDMPVDFVSALSRAVSADQQAFAEHLRRVLSQSGIHPHEVSPAVHDFSGQARASVLAAGSYKHAQVFPHTGTAWTGILGRQPGMLTFQGGAGGPDSVYRFAHQDADAVRQALDRAGVKNRVLVPQDKTFHVFVYDKGRMAREGVAQALTLLGVPAEEWRGTGTPVGGKQDDMGREQYRGVINTAEAAQARGPVQMAGFSVFRGGKYAASFRPSPSTPGFFTGTATAPTKIPTHYQALNDWFEKNKKVHTWVDGEGLKTLEYAKIGNNREMRRDPDDGSLHIRLHNTDVVTAHPDNTYTLRTAQPGYGNWEGYRTPLTHGTQAYFAPGRFSWRHPDFFNGIRIDSQGRPIHKLAGTYGPSLQQLMQEVHARNRPEDKTALNVAIRMLAPSWGHTQGPDTTFLPRLDPRQTETMYNMLVNRGYDTMSPAAGELADHLHTGGKPYTAHALRQLQGAETYEDYPYAHRYRPLAYGLVGGVPVEVHHPVNEPGEFMDPRWKISFGNGPHPEGYIAPLHAFVPQEIGKGILHEIDQPTNTGVMRARFLKAKQTYPSPGMYRHPVQG